MSTKCQKATYASQQITAVLRQMLDGFLLKSSRGLWLGADAFFSVGLYVIRLMLLSGTRSLSPTLVKHPY